MNLTAIIFSGLDRYGLVRVYNTKFIPNAFSIAEHLTLIAPLVEPVITHKYFFDLNFCSLEIQLVLAIEILAIEVPYN